MAKKNNKKSLSINIVNCDRCTASSSININIASQKCETCNKHFCIKCYVIHDKFNECFCEVQQECYICKGLRSFYDYGVKKFICFYHI